MFFIFNNLFGQDEVQQEPDSLLLNNNSSKKISPNAIESSVKYISQDSIIINLQHRKIFLFEDAKAYYEDIELNAAFMEFAFTNSELYASGVADSCGHIHGPPIFKQGGSEFSSQEIKYNFKTKKGKVTKVITEEGEGYIHGYYVKYVEEQVSYIKGGHYTTCNLEHPHFDISFNKAKVIQDDKIITGPAYFRFGDIPSPLAVPFGIFPLQKERASGLVIGRVGEGDNRGFYFEDFGYYLGLNDNFDLLFLGTITTRLWWAAKATSNYVYKYKFNGTVELGFAQNYYGERGTKKRFHTNDFRIYWKHNQDPKSHPTTRFNAQVNILSNTYTKYNPSSANDYLTNQFNSSLNFSTSLKGIFYLDAALSYNQNTGNRDISIGLPNLNMSVNQFYPFRKKLKSGKLKWYDNISLAWRSQMTNQINTKDTLFLLQQTWDEIQSGIQHSIPLTVPIKVGKAFNWNTNATFVEKWYLQRNIPEFSEIPFEDTVRPHLDNLFQRGFFALHNLSLSTSMTTKIYGFYGPRKGVLKVRHVMSPDVNFTFCPNLSGNMYGTYFNTITGKKEEYYYYSGSIYGGVTSNMQAKAQFTLNNNLEMKVKSKKDTITGTRKISIFDNVAISCGYDFAADSLRWQLLTIYGRTSLFSFLDITFALNFDPYIINNEGFRVNQTEAKVNKRALRFSRSDLRIGLNWRLNQDFFKNKKKTTQNADESPPQPETEPVFPVNNLGIPNTRPDFRNPWNITISYIFAITTSDNFDYYTQLMNNKYDNSIIQTLNISGDVNITRKWKLGFTTGYDIQNKDFSYTSIDIYRDLHCWEMKFQWIPFGWRKGWNFQINVKASVLKDLKYEMKRDFIDNL